MMTVRLGSVPGLDRLQFASEPSPTIAPRSGEIRVRIEASSLNAHDYSVAAGRLPSKPGRILLTDAAGIVEAIGDCVTELAVGDRVISCFFPQWTDGDQTVADFSTTPGDGHDGYACGHVVRPAHWFTRAPRHMSSIEAATLPTAALTAWRAMAVEGRIKLGDSVLVLGTGGVSIFALQFAKAMGANVIATSSSDEKLERLRALGANHVINYKRVTEWGKAVRELTNGRGVDHVVEVGGPATLPQSITACRIGSPKDYEFSRDSNTASSGHYSALIAAKPGVVLTGFGTLMQTINAENYRDGRWRLSGYLKTSDATRAQMWMRVDGPDRKVVSFDNMDARPVTGTTGWTRYDIVLDVPSDSVDIAFGFLLTQGGKVWGDNFRLEKVAAEVPVTSPATAATVLPKQPMNIDFENAADTGFKAEKTFKAEKINVYDMFRSNGRHGTQHPRASSDTYNLCGMHVVAQTREHDTTALKWDIMLSVFTDGTSRLASIAAGSFTMPPNVDTIVPRHPITGLVVRLDAAKEPASARIHGVPNADNGVVGDFPEPYAEQMFDALETGMPFTLDLTYDSGEHETVHARTLGGIAGGGGNYRPLGLAHGADAPVHRCLQSLAPASQSGLHNPLAEFNHPW